MTATNWEQCNVWSLGVFCHDVHDHETAVCRSVLYHTQCTWGIHSWPSWPQGHYHSRHTSWLTSQVTVECTQMTVSTYDKTETSKKFLRRQSLHMSRFCLTIRTCQHSYLIKLSMRLKPNFQQYATQHKSLRKKSVVVCGLRFISLRTNRKSASVLSLSLLLFSGDEWGYVQSCYCYC